MKTNEAVKRMENMIICEKCKVHGNPCDDNCPVQYDAGRVCDCIEAMETLVKSAKERQHCFSNGIVYGYRMALEDLGIIKKEGENDAN